MMTPAQRRLRRQWLIILSMIGLSLVFGDFVEAHLVLIRAVVFVCLVIALIVNSRAGGPTGSEMRKMGHERMLEIYESKPWLRIWYVFCVIVLASVAMYAKRNSIDLFHRVGVFRLVILTFGTLFAPLFFVIERERFRQLGEEDDDGI